MPTQKELLHHANLIDARLKAKPGEKVTMPELPEGQKEMFSAEDDPFGGNENNRKAAEHMANKPFVSPSASGQPSLSGDADAAKAALELADKVAASVASQEVVDPNMKPFPVVEPVAPGAKPVAAPTWSPGK